MKIKNNSICLFIYLISIIVNFSVYSQQPLGENHLLQDKAAKVFLDVSRRYHDYIKTEIPYVNYMRDRKEAEVFIMMTRERTGSGGIEYTLTFFGQNGYTGLNDTLKYYSKQNDTEEMIRSGIVKKLKQGLMRYVEKTPFSDYLSIVYKRETEPIKVIDKWNHWVFNINVDADVDGEESSNSLELDGSFSADCVTPEWKISLNINGEYEEDNFEMDSVNITSTTDSWGARGLIVKSLGQHWSVGGFSSVKSSSFSNEKFAVEFAPALEYNIFPYKVSTRRELRLLYRNGFKDVKYKEETIYNKTREQLWYHSLSATFEYKERWGSIRSTLTGSHYFHDFEKNHLTLFCGLNLRLFEGFSLDLMSFASRIHDQLSLSKEDVSEEDLLLRRKQIATNYNYSFRIGFRYTFGSIYSNVVNPRFGNRGGRRRYY